MCSIFIGLPQKARSDLSISVIFLCIFRLLSTFSASVSVKSFAVILHSCLRFMSRYVCILAQMLFRKVMTAFCCRLSASRGQNSQIYSVRRKCVLGALQVQVQFFIILPFAQNISLYFLN